uniref:Uncharacterized protein n=1 Tax=Alexandrium catenella TaxID=2925 RepID=A0A7S1LGK5_ALECA
MVRLMSVAASCALLALSFTAAGADDCAVAGRCSGRNEADEPLSLLQTVLTLPSARAKTESATKASESATTASESATKASESATKANASAPTERGILDLSAWDGKSIPKGWKLLVLNSTEGINVDTMFQPRRQLLQRLKSSGADLALAEQANSSAGTTPGSPPAGKTPGKTAVKGMTSCYDGPSAYMKDCLLYGRSPIFNKVMEAGYKVYPDATCKDLGFYTRLVLCPDFFYGFSGVCLYIGSPVVLTTQLASCPECLFHLLLGNGMLWRSIYEEC